MRLITLACLLFSFISNHAQIAVNTSGSAPHSSAMLDVSSANKGVLIPGVAIVDVSSASPVSSPATGLVVWNTNASVTGGSGAGFYYWNGVKWQSLLSDNTGWRLDGNSNTNPSLHFIGTTDNQPLVFKVNNSHAGKIDPLMNNLFFGVGAGFSISHPNSRRNSLVGDSAGYNLNGLNAADNSFFGYRAGRMATGGFSNSLFGSQTGSKITTGTSNSFFGSSAGRDNNSTGNSFFGANAGLDNIGSNNSFFGRSAGSQNLSGIQNSFFGSSAGDFGTAGSQNSFFGFLAGGLNEGDRNGFFGYNAGLGNQSGHRNNFFGSYAGRANDAGIYNVYIGDSAGYKSAGSFNTLIGARATTGSATPTSTVSNSAAIGHLAQVDTSDGMVLGSINGVNGADTDTRVGIGTTKPKHKLHVVNTNPQDGGWADGIVVESISQGANVGEAAISFRNGDIPSTRQWTTGLNQNPNLAFSYGTSFTGGNTKMLIDTFGNVGVGTITPGAKLEVNGTAIIGANGSLLTNIIKATVNVDLDGGGLPSGTSTSSFVAVANAAVGSTVFVSPQNALPLGFTIAYSRVSAAGMVEIRVTNGGNLNPVNQAAMDVYITVIQ